MIPSDKSTRKKKLRENLFTEYKNVELIFPVCYKTKQGEMFRYYIDGRYEMISKTEKGIHSLLFGKIKQDWQDEEMNWLRIIVSRTQNQLISQEEFVAKFEEIIESGYEKFLSNETIPENDSTLQSNNELQGGLYIGGDSGDAPF